MRDEWTMGITDGIANAVVRNGYGSAAAPGVGTATTEKALADSRSSPMIDARRKTNELDRSASLNLAARAMKLKMKTSKGGETRQREVSERRQVGDAESLVNPPASAMGDGKETPWWRNVGMEEGL